ncbi:MAG: translocation/assembly module TamB domain-containing protein [Muribaculaceae bacterium]|nr:translocation/assembly module TamB domain-containing protein [Muribaculaceae bacterium]
MTISIVKRIYKVLRSVLFTALVAVVALYISLYVLLSIPPVQNYIRNIAEKELSAFLGGKVIIGKLDIFPFNEVRIKNVDFISPEGEKCITVERIGAGIRLWRLVSERRIEITYAEIIGLNGAVVQKEKDGPLNINYILEAFAPKDKTKPPTKFDMMIHNIVIRKSTLSFDRDWHKKKEGFDGFDIYHLKITDLMADVTMPVVKNNNFEIDMRRLSFKAGMGFEVKKLSFKTKITSDEIVLNDFRLLAGRTEIRLNDQVLGFDSFDNIPEVLKRKEYDLHLRIKDFYPEDFRYFYSPLSYLKNRYELNLSAHGSVDNLTLEDLRLIEDSHSEIISLSGIVRNLTDPQKIFTDVHGLTLDVPVGLSKSVLSVIPLNDKDKSTIEGVIQKVGELRLSANGIYSAINGKLEIESAIDAAPGSLLVSANGFIRGKSSANGRFEIKTDNFNIGTISDNDDFREVSLVALGEIDLSPDDINGNLNLKIGHIDYKGNRLTNILAQAEKSGKHVQGVLDMGDRLADLYLEGNVDLLGENSRYSLHGEIKNFYPGALGLVRKYESYRIQGIIDADIYGNSLDNILGELNVKDLSFSNEAGKEFYLASLNLNSSKQKYYGESVEEEQTSQSSPTQNRLITLSTDFLTARLEGDFKFNPLVNGIKSLISEDVTDYVKSGGSQVENDGYAELEVVLKADRELPPFIKLPVKPLTDITLHGGIDMKEGKLELLVDAPYLLQGTNKLISESMVHAVVERGKGSNITANTVFPIKNDRAELELNLNIFRNQGYADIGWRMKKNSSASGNVGFQAALMRNKETGKPDVTVEIVPSTFRLGPSEWNIEKSEIRYLDKSLSIDNLKIFHDDQFVEINGKASSDPLDEIRVSLADIDLSYIFGILNINYVSFGGIATGELTASSVFTKNPVARTKRLTVDDLSYNDAVLGDADIFSCWNQEKKEIEIHADIKEAGYGGARVDGGIFVTRDSLSFDMKADKINVSFLKPFMSAFTSDVGGRASGKVKLFGTFKDIDLIGQAYADSIYMKVDYTNVYYHGSDSVTLNPGMIEIPSFRLYDRFGNSALFSGYVKHSYFHDPVFEFKLSDAKNLLCYETNSKINPDWYGTIFASGRGALKGSPGVVTMEMDMTTSDKSDFTFVLSDTQTALDYAFLTFSDKKKAEAEEVEIVEETFEDKFMKRQEEIINPPTIFSMDLRATVTPGAKLNLIMDPNAGDKIVARGGGPLLIHYDTESDEMTMYGKYTLKEGSYNFSLQELILREFRIKEGSNIAFNGDPLSATLDIVAAYRVNTNLSDLDKSFSTDRDLNRTNVPVDALLNVRGDLQAPDISFDLSLPTLTGDVERKVRSIISTEDQMNRQIIYLLALNRFYTPEYMGSTSNGGGELASVASSTISSQLSNIMGQLTDKFTVAPSFRSDKGDFSDMEVDVSLSSRLLNNRLLLNGNFGYRDKSTSQTTFVGDFDLEYLLSRNGNLRLKAYNHFNDQNYYLKSSLTTQGIGIVYQKEFDNPLSWLRKKKRKEDKGEEKRKQEIPDSLKPITISSGKSEESIEGD